MKRRRSEPESVADLVPAMIRRLGGQGRVVEHRAFDAYDEAIGALLRRRSEPERLLQGTLHVRVASSALAHELIMLRAEILAKLAASLGPGVVTDLRTRVGAVDRA